VLISPLPISVVERVVDRSGRNGPARCSHAVDGQLNRVGAGLLIRGHVFQLRHLLQLRHKVLVHWFSSSVSGFFKRVLVLRAAHAIVHRDVLHRLHIETHALTCARLVCRRPESHSEALMPLGTRSSSGFRLIEMRPLLRVVLMPSAPMNEDRLSTAGSGE